MESRPDLAPTGASRWRGLLRDMRLHPSRFVAILLAVTLSLALLAGTQVFAATESAAIAKRSLLYASRADVVVDSHVWNSDRAVSDRDRGLDVAEASLRANPQVADVERFSQLYVQLTSGERYATVMLNASPASDRLRWYAPTQGRLPQAPDEIVLTAATAAELGVVSGERVQLGVAGWVTELTVVGLTDEAGFTDPPAYVPLGTILDASANLPPSNTSAIINPRSTEQFTPGSSGTGVGLRLLVATRSSADADAVVQQTQADLDDQGIMKIVVWPKTAAQVRTDATAALTGQTTWMAGVLLACGLLAIALGAVVVANTFSVLMAQRRRQIALLRLVGASRGQVLRRYGGEASVLALTGTALGVPLGVALAAAASAWWTRSLSLGLELPHSLAWLLPAALLVILAASLVSLVPATRARPLEALGSAALEPARRAGLGVAAIALVSILGAGATGYALASPDARGGWLVGGALALTLGVGALLVGIVPALLRGIGRLLRRPVGRLAVGNLLRHPRRTRAAAVGIVLAVGLIGAVLVGVGSGRESAFAAIDRRSPVDLSLQASSPPLEYIGGYGPGDHDARNEDGQLIGMAPGALERVTSTPGIARAGLFATTEPVWVIAGTAIADQLPMAALTPEAQELLHAPVELAPDQIGLPRSRMDALKISDGSLVLLQPLIGERASVTVVEVNVNENLAVASAALVEKLRTPTNPGLILAQVEDRDHAGTVVERLTSALTPGNPGLTIDGSIQARVGLAAQLDAATRLVVGLLGVAAFVAVVGLANTLSLSVIERTRESGLLRALGFRRADLEAMVLVEALALSATAGLLALPLGMLAGWLGAAVVTAALGLTLPPLVVPWMALLGLWLGTVAVAVVAGLIPARRAGRVTPIAALSDLG